MGLALKYYDEDFFMCFDYLYYTRGEPLNGWVYTNYALKRNGTNHLKCPNYKKFYDKWKKIRGVGKIEDRIIPKEIIEDDENRR